MQRRKFLQAVAVGGSLSLAGCTGLVSSADSGANRRPPDEVTAAFFQALSKNNFDTARALVHDETPDEDAQTLLAGDEQYIERLSQLAFTVHQTEIIDNGDEKAIVEINLTQRRNDNTRDLTTQFELRSVDGKWLLWDQLSG